MTFLLTIRGIPQIYYGTEILLRRFGEHCVLRQDFPGGWEDDERNAFMASERSEEENVAFDHLKKLLNWRKTSKAASEGDLKHFVPYDNVHVYSRSTPEERIVVFMNNNEEDKEIDMSRFEEVLKGYDSGKDVLGGEKIKLSKPLGGKGNSSMILQIIASEAN